MMMPYVCYLDYDMLSDYNLGCSLSSKHTPLRRAEFILPVALDFLDIFPDIQWNYIGNILW